MKRPRISLYPSAEIKDRLEERRKKNRRSMNGEIMILLERLLAEEIIVLVEGKNKKTHL